MSRVTSVNLPVDRKRASHPPNKTAKAAKNAKINSDSRSTQMIFFALLAIFAVQRSGGRIAPPQVIPQKRPAEAGLNHQIGWGAGIRTPILRSRAACPTIGRHPSRDADYIKGELRVNNRHAGRSRHFSFEFLVLSFELPPNLPRDLRVGGG